ncbi:MoaD/ThiS family protein [Gudongella oleilytica]|jgi:formiminotetrahydrofolate cyclodeaminase|uniref:MoaD/ThiS family protein n=1 Tax=Gudongella oleilytica TaxID=1582259 RepID=UPI000EE537F5|nr:MoaD/ThiS family protein [Gudongella oleilytica]HCO18033.1 hypothetical protein [Tissierellales bacterium]
MKIYVKYLGVMDYDLPLEIIINEGSTIKNLFDEILDDDKELFNSVFLVNNLPASLEQELKEGDTLLILQVLGGG